MFNLPPIEKHIIGGQTFYLKTLSWKERLTMEDEAKGKHSSLIGLIIVSYHLVDEAGNRLYNNAEDLLDGNSNLLMRVLELINKKNDIKEEDIKALEKNS